MSRYIHIYRALIAKAKSTSPFCSQGGGISTASHHMHTPSPFAVTSCDNAHRFKPETKSLKLKLTPENDPSETM